MGHPEQKRRIAGIALLADPTREALYEFVAGSEADAGREEAARALGISKNLAAFHLDKLAAAGLLEVSYRRPAGAGGPGAGRPAKLYRRSANEIQFSLPERRYGLAALLFLSAIERSRSRDALAALNAAAFELGRDLGERAAGRAGERAGLARRLLEARAVLAGLGFEPKRRRAGIVLRNCPFHALARANREAVCGMNHRLVQGIVRGLALQGVSALLDPRPGLCCVRLEMGGGDKNAAPVDAASRARRRVPPSKAERVAPPEPCGGKADGSMTCAPCSRGSRDCS